MALPPENALKTECEHGHPLSGDNLLVLNRRNGRRERVCRTCARARSKRYFAAHYVPHPRPKKPPPPPKPPRDPKAPKELLGRPRKPALDRIASRLIFDENGCWIWLGAKNKQGYGVIQLGRGAGEGTARTHRVVYETLVGPIPEGFTVDHLCFQASCCNPDHLEAVTRAENARRQWAAGHGKPKSAPRLL